MENVVKAFSSLTTNFFLKKKKKDNLVFFFFFFVNSIKLKINGGEGTRAGSSVIFSHSIVKNFVKIRQHDSDVSPRPRRPFQSDSSSRYYNKSSDVTGQGRIIGDNVRSVTSSGEGGGGRRQQQQQQYNNNQSDYLLNSSSSSPSSYNRGNNSSDYNQSGGYNNWQNFGNYNNQGKYYSSNFENGRQYGSNTNNGISGAEADNSSNIQFGNQNGSTERASGNYRSDDLGRSGGENRVTRTSQYHQDSDSVRRAPNNSYNNLERGGGGAVGGGQIPSAQKTENQRQQQQPSGLEGSEKERWVPPSLRPQHGLTQKEKNDAIFRKVRGILNKLTPEKFQELSDDLLQIDLNSTVVLNGVILLIFDKALDEPKYSSMYAQLCKRLSKEAPNFDDPPNPNICTFLRLLLNVCRDKFESRSVSAFGISSGLSPLSPESYIDKEFRDGEITTEEEEKRHVAKQRMLGNVKFIGELSKLQMLSEHVLHTCIQSLLDKKQRPNANFQDCCEDMECLCQLIRTCGKNLDTEQGKKLMEQYFHQMDKSSKSKKYPPRIRFMLRDIIELRENTWIPRKVTATEGPVPIRQIRTDDDNIRPQYNNHRRDIRNNDRDGDNWMNRFPLNLQSGFNDMFSNLGVRSTSPIMSPGYNNNNRHHNQRNNQNLHHNNFNNRFNKHNNHNNHQFNNSHNNTGNGLSSGNSMNSYNNMTNKDIAPRFKRTLISTGQESVDNLQMRPAANSLLFKANMSIKTPPLMAISAPRTGFGAVPLTFGNTQMNSSGPALSFSNATTPASETGNATTINLSPINLGGNRESGGGGGMSFNSNTSTEQTPTLNLASNKNSEKSSSPLTTSNALQTPKENYSTSSGNKQQSSAEKTSNNIIKAGKKDKGPNKEEVLKKVTTFLTENLFGNEDVQSQNLDEIVSAFVELKIPDKFMKDTSYLLLNEILEKSELQHEYLFEFLQELRNKNKLQSNSFLEGFKLIVNKMNEKESTIPKITTLVASLLSRAVTTKLCNLADIAIFTDGGQHYPLLLLVLQQLHKSIGRDALEELFVASKVNLLSNLPEADRNKDRLADILEDRNLTFLYPLLKVQAEMLKQIQTDDNPQAFYKWIKATVDLKYHTDSGFITSLVAVILKYITQETSLMDGTDTAKYPEKLVIEREEALLQKYCTILENFLSGNTELQLVAVYALQVFCFNVGFPKGMLCRWFKNLYEANVIEEEAFFRWKEEISDEHPGKGQALFQVNNWLTWLEQAESEDED